MKEKEYGTSTKRIRDYRTDKRRLRRPQLTLRVDQGAVEEITTIHFPRTADIQEHFIPKKANPHLKAIIRWPVEMIWYTDSGKGFVYDTDHNYLGSLERSDLKRLFSRSGALLRLEKK